MIVASGQTSSSSNHHDCNGLDLLCVPNTGRKIVSSPCQLVVILFVLASIKDDIVLIQAIRGNQRLVESCQTKGRRLLVSQIIIASFHLN